MGDTPRDPLALSLEVGYRAVTKLPRPALSHVYRTEIINVVSECDGSTVHVYVNLTKLTDAQIVGTLFLGVPVRVFLEGVSNPIRRQSKSTLTNARGQCPVHLGPTSNRKAEGR